MEHSEDLLNVAKDGAMDIIDSLVPVLLGEAAVPCSISAKLIRYGITFRDTWFWHKFVRFVNEGILNEKDCANFCGQLGNGDESKKKENARRIIQIIDRIETDKKMDYVINATYSFVNNYINRTTYFRICNVIINTLQEDLEFLQNNVAKNHSISYSDEVQGLVNQGLMEKEGPAWHEIGETVEFSGTYKFTILAKDVDKYSLSNSNFERYPDLIKGGNKKQWAD